ncbi:putative transcriptional regulator [Beutenbergia cavernae DSM 12333]|uniref:Putative transcriptional regulator n=1 Tax=Beutenbergia cavernae (strain ATCC BAA-8 / DSM 12333 / CCUG 43141 / JCM 11478 / NBRC 16432 / NCIMB 13614 / HKI 0122) TaxID=471853 RepID=C5BVZ1_BEUC1|nr:transcriptional regulator [Beutenbergia cavernae]ACQ80592.1 putative transcriptional regulator [Beutenbergia cavernae DSM 12333]
MPTPATAHVSAPQPMPAAAPTHLEHDHDASTRERVRDLVLQRGPIEAARLADLLDLTPAGVRRHLGALEASGQIAVQAPPASAHRGRGRPPKRYVAALAAHDARPDASSDLAADLLRYLTVVAGPDALDRFADQREAELERRYAPIVEAAGHDVDARTRALAAALTDDGYAASSRPLPSLLALQLCQGHCPVQQVAAQFPQLCEAETRAFARLLGTHVQRLATIASGHHACTTHVPATTAPPAVLPHVPDAPGRTVSSRRPPDPVREGTA